ncbi:hypothetical protein BFW38_07370 [Terasakiispira papahanaumokuakeensis]|uniref:KfrA N-terminal DNA-binding domain-containing protein n=1 Tax=Terasakiispira papahanaumokuakeensis TaxID=197479 RepID=A0A1E2V9A6_9GAMM|nr:DNA-binding protein [Terasakiispira papahanaumokuakeensis]ODC03396.1 hypothetical protein BFW38_07370 [Terasakiispira papahanaumokuakeensis]
MARRGIQYEDVTNSIEALRARGLAPTVQNIRDQLGTGSFSTINEHLKQWRALSQPSSGHAEQDLPAGLAQLTGQLWKAAQEEAYAALESQREAANAEIEAAQIEKQEAQAQALHMEERNIMLDQKNNELLAELKTLTDQRATLRTERDQALKETNVKQQRITTLENLLDEQKTQVEQLKIAHQAALEAVQQRMDEALEQERQRQAEQEAYWLKEIDQARQQLAHLETEHKQTMATYADEKAQWQASRQQWQQQQQHWEESHQYLEQTLVQLKQQNEELKQTEAAWWSRWEGQEKRLHDLQAEQAQLIKEKESLRSALEQSISHRHMGTFPPFIG